MSTRARPGLRVVGPQPHAPARQGLTLVHFPAQPKPFLSLTADSQTAYLTESAQVEPKGGRV